MNSPINFNIWKRNQLAKTDRLCTIIEKKNDLGVNFLSINSKDFSAEFIDGIEMHEKLFDDGISTLYQQKDSFWRPNRPSINALI